MRPLEQMLRGFVRILQFFGHQVPPSIVLKKNLLSFLYRNLRSQLKEKIAMSSSGRKSCYDAKILDHHHSKRFYGEMNVVPFPITASFSTSGPHPDA
jgi:hypothetical protein